MTQKFSFQPTPEFAPQSSFEKLKQTAREAGLTNGIFQRLELAESELASLEDKRQFVEHFNQILLRIIAGQEEKRGGQGTIKRYAVFSRERNFNPSPSVITQIKQVLGVEGRGQESAFPTLDSGRGNVETVRYLTQIPGVFWIEERDINSADILVQRVEVDPTALQ